MEKNLNKVRNVHPVFRSIKFKDIKQVAMFINLYKDLFFISQDDIRIGWLNGFWVKANNEQFSVSFKIRKSDWDRIQKDLKLKNDKEHPYNQHIKTRYWIYED